MTDSSGKKTAGAAPRAGEDELLAWIAVYEYQQQRLVRTYEDFADTGRDLHQFFFEYVYIHPRRRARFEKRDMAFVRIARNWLFRKITTREMHDYLECVIALQVMTDTFDLRLGRYLLEAGVRPGDGGLPHDRYREAYRAVASRAQRIQQVECVLKTFELCNRVVNEFPLNLDQILRYTPRVFLRNTELLNLCVEAYHTFHRHGAQLDAYDAVMREREFAYIETMFGGDAGHA